MMTNEKEEVANFTLDYDQSLLLLAASGEYLIRLSPTLTSKETLYLPKRIFRPKKVLANFRSIFITNHEALFILERKRMVWQEIFPFNSILDFCLSPQGEIFLIRPGERNVVKIDQFFRVRTSPFHLNFYPQGLTSLGEEVYFLNEQKKELAVYDRNGLFLKNIPLPDKKSYLFSPQSAAALGSKATEGRVSLFSEDDELFLIEEDGVKIIPSKITGVKSCLFLNDSFYLLTKEDSILKIPAPSKVD